MLQEYRKKRLRSSNTDINTLDSSYLDRIAKKHKASNKKGSYNTHFHIAGDPEKEAKIFNHMMLGDYDSDNTLITNMIPTSKEAIR